MLDREVCTLCPSFLVTPVLVIGRSVDPVGRVLASRFYPSWSFEKVRGSNCLLSLAAEFVRSPS